jgi:hypothetical protein
MNTQPVRILVTGSRKWDDADLLVKALEDAWHDVTQLHGPDRPLVIVHGGASGADYWAKAWAMGNGLAYEEHPADWENCAQDCPREDPEHRRQRGIDQTEYCPKAGPRRNQLMVDLGADLVLAFHRANSYGTADCIRRASKAGIPIRRYAQ